MPVFPEATEGQQGFIPGLGPELATPLHPALKLPAGRFNRARPNRLVPLFSLLVPHAMEVVGVILHRGVDLLGLRLAQRGQKLLLGAMGSWAEGQWGTSKQMTYFRR